LIVIDASVLVDLLIGRPGAALIGDVLLRRTPWHAPHLIDVEVGQGLRRLAYRRMIPERRAAEAVGELGQLDLRRHAHTPFLERIWQLRHGLTAYDATYVALAEALAIPLITRDAKLAAARNHDTMIELV
jgi:predicted nucleic acid-binding protein